MDQILFVDDDAFALDSYLRLLQRQFRIATARGGEDGLSAIEKSGPFAVVISDMRMPGMNGADFLGHVRLRAPDTIRMLLTGYADVNAAIEAVNKGNIFRYLTKPCAKGSLVEAIQLGLAHYHSTIAGRNLEEKAREWMNDSSISLSRSGSLLPGSDRAKRALSQSDDGQLVAVLIRFSAKLDVDQLGDPTEFAEYIRLTTGFLQQSLSVGDQLYQWDQGALLALVSKLRSAQNLDFELRRLLALAIEYDAEIMGKPAIDRWTVDFEILGESERRELLAR